MSDDMDELFGLEKAGRKSFTERLGHKLPVEPPLHPVAPYQFAEYEPYGYSGGGRADEGCTIYSWLEGTTIPIGAEFPWRLYMGCDFHNDTELRILLPHRIIVIEGQKLGDLRHQLGRRAVNFVQQTHATIWPGPIGGATINRIEIVTSSSALSKTNDR